MVIREKKVTTGLEEYPCICSLMKTAFPRNEQFPMRLLRLLPLIKEVNFQAFKKFCGIYRIKHAL